MMFGRFPVSSSIGKQEALDSSPYFLQGEKKMASTATIKRCKRGVQKRMISVPIKGGEGSQRSENAAPPPDSWAWRKYGQKPIKGSPYPRGYYRCSSCKGCPARKQVERSKVDPTMLMITYSFEHEHQWPLQTNHAQSIKSSDLNRTKNEESSQEIPEIPKLAPVEDLGGGEVVEDDFFWFGGMDSFHSTGSRSSAVNDSAAAPASSDMLMREDYESLFADLGELPDCSAVFQRHRGIGPQMQIC